MTTNNLQSTIANLQSPLGLGMAALGRPGYITLGHGDDLNADYSVAAMEAHAHKVLDAAWAMGVRYFDAARSYGRAEQFLGSWLKAQQIPPAEVVVGSKWGYTYTADWQVDVPEGIKHEVKEHSLSILRLQYMESHRELGDYLNLYQIHSATLESGVLENYEVLARLAEMRDYGLTIGLSVSGTEQGETIQRALTIELGGRRLFGSVQATWNLLEQSAGSALQAAHDAGLMVIVKEAVANGRLTSRNDSLEFALQIALLKSEAARLNTTVDGLAIAAALNQPWSTVVLSGAARADHLASNVGATEVTWKKRMMELLANLRESSETYWSTRSSLAWN